MSGSFEPLSVLISLYDAEAPRFLDACLESLAKQSRQAQEVVLVLDGPVSSSHHQVIDKWQATLPLRVVPLPENVGLGRALAAGVGQCSHELVMRMDTDDLCKPERIALQAAYMAQHPEVQLSGAWIDEVDSETELFLGRRVVPEECDAIRRLAVWRNPFNHMTVIFRKKGVLAAGGYQHQPGMEDYDLWLRMIGCGMAMCNLPAVVVTARVDAEFLARRSGGKYLRAEWRLHRRKVREQVAPPVLLWLVFVCRSASRVLPVTWLASIYRQIRKG